MRGDLDGRLAAQNHLTGYRDCVLEGGAHKLDRSRANVVVRPDGSRVEYVPCRRCPADIGPRKVGA